MTGRLPDNATWGEVERAPEALQRDFYRRLLDRWAGAAANTGVIEGQRDHEEELRGDYR